MNTIYKKTEKSQRKIKTFSIGELEQAINYGFDLAHKKTEEQFFIITENNKCLKFNTTIVL